MSPLVQTSLKDRFDLRALGPQYVNRGPAIWATALALALINVGAAATIVVLIGSAKGVPLWAGLAVTALGVVILAIAVRLWRAYLRTAHEVTHGGSARSRASSPGEKAPQRFRLPKHSSQEH